MFNCLQYLQSKQCLLCKHCIQYKQCIQCLKGGFNLFKQSNDAFIVNELIGNSLTDLIIEEDIYIPENLHSMEKIIYTSGKVKINNISTLNNKVAVYGELNYTIIYRGSDEDSTTQATNGKIDFMEEIPVQGVTERMSATINPSIDYIDSKIVSDRKALVKAVININTEATNSHNVEYISSIESDGTFQAKTNNITYTDISSRQEIELPLSESIVLDPNMNEVLNILKVDVVPKISEADIMNERMLIEGTCNVGVLYTEDNSFSTLNYITKEFPFTHYIEFKNADDSMMKKVNINVSNVDSVVSKDDNDERKVIGLDIDMSITTELYNTVNRNIISDAYSTTNNIDIESSDISLSSIIDFKTSKDNFEKTFDVDNVTIKDIYYYDAVAKISEKNIYEDSIVIDGFIDTNVIFLNGDNNKVDSVSSSIPFTSTVDLTGYENISDVDVKLTLDDVGAYRKGLNTILLEAKIVNELSIKDNKNIYVINNITLGEKINNKNIASIIFRVVQPNETLWDIAKNYNVSMNYLGKLNNLDINDNLTPGSKIIISKQV